MKNILAVCDREEAYAHRLMEYFSSKKAMVIKTVAFSEEESLCRYAGENPVAVLLISETMLNGETMKISAGKKIILTESRESRPEEAAYVYKYQSAAVLLKEVMSCYDAESAALGNPAVWRGKKRLIGIYSPVGGTRKTSFALTMGQVYAREGAALYLNLESFSGLSEMLGQSFASGLSELLYYAGQKTSDPLAKLSTLTVSVQNLDILPPADTPEDLHGIPAAKWIRLFEMILQNSTYETVVAEMGADTDEIALLLEYCSCVYVPVRDDPFAEAKIRELTDYLKDRGVSSGKVHFVRLPFHASARLGREYCENLLWSELGDYVRRLCKEEQV